jgi:hypothetical protein
VRRLGAVQFGEERSMNPNDDEATPEAIHSRAELLPEEHAAGASLDAEAQARAILKESEERVNAPQAGSGDAADDGYEHRRSEDLR